MWPLNKTLLTLWAFSSIFLRVQQGFFNCFLQCEVNTTAVIIDDKCSFQL